MSDMHIHSNFSDGQLSIPELIDFYGEAEFDVIAITDHFCEERSILGRAAAYLNRTLTRESFPLYIQTIQQEAERAWKKYEMLVIPGYEITKNSIQNHRSAHILALGMEQIVSPDQDALNIAKQVKEQDGLCIAAHPISKALLCKKNLYLWDRRRELSPYIDAWELTDQGKIIPEMLISKLPRIATSDLHHPKHINSWKTVLHCKKEMGFVFEAVRKQKLSFRYFNLSMNQNLALIA